ncbi:hypothetical protein BGY98DRAFT_1092737 [Russula aff. rugulosa BPL654]|nr:hypothetical protein BGY98DRAFT_1092737 [Russula aff. rugulosa BPL654]
MTDAIRPSTAAKLSDLCQKLDENDNLKDFATSVTEFCEAAFADANVRELKQKTLEFIRIPDGRAVGLAGKAGGTAAKAPWQSKGEDSN